MSTGLSSVYVIENDVNNDLIAWGYPSIDVKVESVLKERCGLHTASTLGTAFCSRFQAHWQYFLSAPVAVKGSKVVSVSIVLLADQYNVPKYEALLALLLKQYLSSPALSMVPVQQTFLSAYAAGKVAVDGEKWADAGFDARLSLIAPLHVLVEALGVEAVMLWVAVLCKQRVIVHHTKHDELALLVRAVPALGGWHRQRWSHLRPVTGLTEPEVRCCASMTVDPVTGYRALTALMFL